MARHPQTVANTEGRLVGVTNSPYSSEGEKQAEALIKYLSYGSYDEILSSPIRRACHIGEMVSQNLSVELNIVEWLREINFGEYEGVAHKDFIEMGVDIDDYRENLLHFRYPGGQTWNEFYEDRKQYVDAIKEEDKTCLFTAHGGVIWAMTTALLNYPLDTIRQPVLSNAGVIVVEYKDGFGKLVSLTEIEEIKSQVL
jgi:broad specificity phosphatase PhoE